MKPVERLYEIFFPGKCVACGEMLPRGERLLCRDCEEQYEKEQQEECPNCFAPQTKCRCGVGNVAQRHLSGYASPVTRALILAGKDRRNLPLSEFFADHFVKLLRSDPMLSFDRELTCLAYIPRNPKTVKKSGCDQAKLFAEALARKLDLPIVHALSHRTDVRLGDQKSMTPAERRKAAKKRYAYRKECEKEGTELFGKSVFLLDDVITTGASVSACAAILLKHGAAQVIAIAPAKTNFEQITLRYADGENQSEVMPQFNAEFFANTPAQDDAQFVRTEQ